MTTTRPRLAMVRLVVRLSAAATVVNAVSAARCPRGSAGSIQDGSLGCSGSTEEEDISSEGDEAVFFQTSLTTAFDRRLPRPSADVRGPAAFEPPQGDEQVFLQTRLTNRVDRRLSAIAADAIATDVATARTVSRGAVSERQADAQTAAFAVVPSETNLVGVADMRVASSPLDSLAAGPPASEQRDDARDSAHVAAAAERQDVTKLGAANLESAVQAAELGPAASGEAGVSGQSSGHCCLFAALAAHLAAAVLYGWMALRWHVPRVPMAALLADTSAMAEAGGCTSDIQMCGAAAALLAPPKRAPAPVVDKAKGSFIVPWTDISGCGARNLSVDIPVKPAVLPFHARFSRKMLDNHWSSIELTVDILDAAGLPPLLRATCITSCSAAWYSRVALSTGGDTGGDTGGTCGSQQLCAGSGECQGTPLVEVKRGDGTLAAIVARFNGEYTIQRPGLASWPLSCHWDAGGCSLSVNRKGLQIAVASSHRGVPPGAIEKVGAKEYVLLETHAEPSSPEATLLFMSMLGFIVWLPANS